MNILTKNFTKVQPQLFRTKSVVTLLKRYEGFSQKLQPFQKISSVKKFQDIPKPTGLPIVGTSLEYSSRYNFDPSSLGEHWIKRHQCLGSIYKENVIPGLTESIVYCSSPADTEKLFREEEACPFRDPLGPLDKARKQLGAANGLTNANGEEWKKIRQVINPLMLRNENVLKFSQNHYQVAKDFVDFIQTNLDKNNEVPNFDIALNKWAFECIGVVALNSRMGAFKKNLDPVVQKMLEDNSTIIRCLGRLLYSLPIWKFKETTDFKLLKESHSNHLTVTEKQLMKALEARNGCKYVNPIMEGILNSNQLCNRSKLMLMSEFLTAGIDTTANCVVFFLYALAMNKEMQDLVREELATALKENGIDGKALSEMSYFNAFTKEVQRMFPFVGNSTRRFSKSINLSGYQIPAGTHIINTSNVVNSRNPNYFENPNMFRPERWLEDKTLQQRQQIRFAMSGPFGMGSRMCPGRKFAMQEIRTFLTVLLSRYRVEYRHKPMCVKFRLVSFPSEKPQFRFTRL